MSAETINLINTILIYLVLLSGLAALTLNLKRDLMMLQLNSYRNERYVRWFNQSEESTSMVRIGSCISLFALLAFIFPLTLSAPVAIIIMTWIAVSLAVKKYKKPLVWTKRAKRIYLTMSLICVLCIVLPGVLARDLGISAYIAVGLNVFSPLVLLLSNLLLRPVEKHINKKFYDDAANILRRMPDLKIVGITGSYGKTSTKHYLNRILAEKYDVMMTPGSYNTTMGVIRTIREYLKPYNEVFIVEMGAKQPGDIKEICDLVKPQMGIVTAVGEQHLESFKSIENIQKTKFELIDALPEDGLGVVNDDFEMAANREVNNVKCLRYAVNNTGNADYKATGIILDPTGTTFTVEGNGEKLTLHTKLVGECNISNLMGAVIIARALGVEDEKIRYAVAKIEQVEHRLNMKRTPGGVTIIDDAFNSNPTGSRMALDVLGAMTGGKRILVTPGMIELGERQYDLNADLGRHAASNSDIVIVVGQYNRDAIGAGLREGGMSEDKIHFADTFADAQRMLGGMLAKGDTVLYENDLPDTFK